MINPAKRQFYTTILKLFSIGISDGLIIPFAFITGYSVITSSNQSIVTAGLYFIFIGAAIMGTGSYFAAKGRRESLSINSTEEEQLQHKEELENTIRLFKQLDLGKEMEDQAAVEMEKENKEWKNYLQTYIPSEEIKEDSPLLLTSLVISLAYVLGGFIPLLPYWMLENKKDAFTASCICSIAALFLFGYIKSKLRKEPLLWGITRLVFFGIMAAIAAYLIAGIFAGQH